MFDYFINIIFNKYSLFSLGIGFVLDLIIGDPQGRWHPICLIGNLIKRSENFLRNLFPKNKKGERFGGLCLVLFIITFCFFVPFIMLVIAGFIHPILRIVLESIMCYYILATKSLKTESMKVYYALDNNDIEKARDELSMIVGRDTKTLDEAGMIKAAVETVAENTCDGIVAPMIYIAILGAPLGFLYKGINTMDSMIGYKNDKYINFGRFAAKLDDIANYVPARISAFAMIIASLLLKYDAKGAYHIFKRDRYNHASPNSAQTEAVAAGALQIQLAGDAYYFGKLHHKKTIGDSIRKVENEDIKKVNHLLYGTAFISITILELIGYGLWLFIR